VRAVELRGDQESNGTIPRLQLQQLRFLRFIRKYTPTSPNTTTAPKIPHSLRVGILVANLGTGVPANAFTADSTIIIVIDVIIFMQPS
jgi:hypothetical protein